MKKRKSDHIIAVVHVTNRVKQAALVQKKLTAYGANIKTRIGLHEPDGRAASSTGLIILELVGPTARCGRISSELDAIPGVEVKALTFSH